MWLAATSERAKRQSPRDEAGEGGIDEVPQSIEGHLRGSRPACREGVHHDISVPCLAERQESEHGERQPHLHELEIAVHALAAEPPHEHARRDEHGDRHDDEATENGEEMREPYDHRFSRADGV